MATITSSDHHRLSISKKQLNPLMLRDYLLDDLTSSCSSNGFKSIPRLQTSSSVRHHLDAEIKRSRMFRHNRRLTCGLVITHAVQKASTALLTAVKLLPFPSSVKSPSRNRDGKIKNSVFSRSFWIKSSRRDRKNQRRSQDRVLSVSPTVTLSGEVTLSSNAAYESSSFTSELFTEVAQSSSGEPETSNTVEDTTETFHGGVMTSGDCVGSHVRDGSCLNDKTEECVNEDREQLSPISVLECPFEDDNPSYQNGDEKKLLRKSRRFKSFIRLEPLELVKRIEKHAERQDYNSYMVETEEDQSENRANRLFALLKARLIEEKNHLLASHKVDNLLLDFFKEEGDNETRDEDKLVKIAEEWVIRREEEEEESMFMGWEVREKREIYVKEMKWGCINEDEKEYVVEEMRNSFLTSLVEELTLDLSL